MFPEQRNRQLYIMGESYGGKYAASLAHKITVENGVLPPEHKINLKGIGIGNGFCDPINMIHWGDFLFTIGMAGYEERDRFRELAQAARQQIKKEKWTLAARLIDTILGGVMTPGHTSMFTNVTAYNYYFNFRLPVEPKEFTYYFQFLDLIPVREAIHVGKTVYHNSRKVQTKIFPDMGRSVKNKIENLLNKGLKVLVYNGMLDIAVAYPLTESFVDNLEWEHKEGFDAAPRWQWKFGAEMAGYVKEHKNLGLVLVRNAGHLVPFDQPVLGFDLVNRFTSSKMF
ncbi:unnamed protein product [Notodromas monacha]|uniref:Carboxypeptidase n=1 Tax=Notodromas monacha TaxID=399045 RepID=A0A7R9GJH8_9CRUS|nr:unnamed protein product [Notodromas monacha]CAG0923574.1 unnamed protein product [Notodromas monacha]